MTLAIMVGDICPGWGIPGRDRPPMLNAMFCRGIPCIPCIAHSTVTAVPSTKLQACHCAQCRAKACPASPALCIALSLLCQAPDCKHVSTHDVGPKHAMHPLHRTQHCHCCLKHQVASMLSNMLDFSIP